MADPVAVPDTEKRFVYSIMDIMGFLPHRYPFLLVDRILEIEGEKRIVGLKNVTINEPFFQGHFPGAPVMPGVLIIECMAQERSEERRVGKECATLCRSRWSPYH